MGEVWDHDSQSEYNLKIKCDPPKYLESANLQGRLLLGAHFCNDVKYQNDKEAAPATVTRKINNSVAVEGVGIYATRKITIGEEILMDYLWKDEDAVWKDEDGDDIEKWEGINYVKVPPKNDNLWSDDDE